MRSILLFATIALLAAHVPAAAQPDTAPKRPNFLVIVADDLGYTDLGAFGGEIETPNLDSLVRKGIQFTSFYTAPSCSPTRAMLLTSRDNHRVGLGTMAEMILPGQGGKQGYAGVLDPTTPTIGKLLSSVGYSTFMSGKWHLGLGESQSPGNQGFERYFALLGGAHNHFGADQDGAFKASGGGGTYRENGLMVRYPLGRYSTDYFTDRMIDYIESAEPGRPFFGYLAYTAPHWPIQAPDEVIAKYHGKYDAGPAALRDSRIARMKELGLVAADAVPAKETFPDWGSLSPASRAVESRRMEVYAAMVDRLDQNIGRLVAALKASGQFDNTVIIFLSDNGAEGMRVDRPINIKRQIVPGSRDSFIDVDVDNSAENIGRYNSYTSYGPDWARAGTAVFRGLKYSTTEGGIRTPAFAIGPGIAQAMHSAATTHVLDIMPTVLELAGAAPRDGGSLDGRSWTNMLYGHGPVRVGNAAVGWELFYRRAVRVGSYKAIYLPNVIPALGGSLDQAHAEWELYDIDADPGETHNLARSHPKILQTLIATWEGYAKRVGVVTYEDGSK